jgi:hypothetical protein
LSRVARFEQPGEILKRALLAARRRTAVLREMANRGVFG